VGKVGLDDIFHLHGQIVWSDPGNGVGTNFVAGVGEVRTKGLRAGVGFLGRGQSAPPHQLGDLRKRCKLLQRGPGQRPDRRRVFLYSEPSDCLSQHLSTCWIQIAWLGIRPTYCQTYWRACVAERHTWWQAGRWSMPVIDSAKQRWAGNP